MVGFRSGFTHWISRPTSQITIASANHKSSRSSKGQDLVLSESVIPESPSWNSHPKISQKLGESQKMNRLVETIFMFTGNHGFSRKYSWLVVWTPLKNMKVSWDYYSNIWKNKKCSKPPTRYPLENQVSQLCSTTAAPGPVKWPLLQRCDSCDMEWHISKNKTQEKDTKSRNLVNRNNDFKATKRVNSINNDRGLTNKNGNFNQQKWEFWPTELFLFRHCQPFWWWMLPPPRKTKKVRTKRWDLYR